MKSTKQIVYIRLNAHKVLDEMSSELHNQM